MTTEERLARLEKAIAALTEIALDARVRIWAVQHALPVTSANAKARQEVEMILGSTMQEFTRTFRKEAIQAGALLQEGP